MSTKVDVSTVDGTCSLYLLICLCLKCLSNVTSNFHNYFSMS